MKRNNSSRKVYILLATFPAILSIINIWTNSIPFKIATVVFNIIIIFIYIIYGIKTGDIKFRRLK